MNAPAGLILVVDDDPLMRMLLVSLLRHLGHRLIEASNGADALASAIREGPDLVLLDVMLPDMDGFAVCRLLRATPVLADMPVVMITALDDRSARICGIEAGADDFLCKPIVREELRARVQMILRLNRYRRLHAERVQRAIAEAESHQRGIELHEQLRRHAADLEQVVAARTAELRQERDRTRHILEALGEAVVVTDCAGTILYVNPAASAISGVSREALLGKRWLAQAEASSAALADVSAALGAGQGWQGELLMRRGDGSTYHTALTLAPLYDSAAPDTLSGFVGVQRDITAMKAVEQLKEAFVLNVSHELRTPLTLLTLLTGNLETLYRKLPDEQRLAMIRQIREQTRQLVDLVEDILQLSQLVGQGRRDRFHPTDLAALVREELDALSSLAQRKQQKLLHTASPALIVQGSPSQLRQIIRNLVTNALKYTPVGGTIDCAICLSHAPAALGWPGSAQLPAGSWVALQISDTGIGIAPEALPHIFERFYRGQSEGPIRGTGLGLAIVAELTAQHGGRIAVASRLGIGSTFAVYLPCPRSLP
jgi:PAS domain S-box-containing protein